KASRSSARRSTLHIAVLPAEATVLLRLGRYDEVREIVRRGRALLKSQALANFAKTDPNLGGGIVFQEGLMALNLGHLDAVFNLGREASAGTITDPARALISAVLTAKGRFKEALDALVYEPSDFYNFLEAIPPTFDFQEESPMELLSKDELFQQTAEK